MKTHPDGPLVCAHRGASYALPDNSLVAFSAAIAAGADVIETDVRMTADGRLVLAHDTWDVTAPGVAELSELIDLARGRIALDLEVVEAGFESKLLDSIEGFGDGLIVTSLFPEILREISRLDPRVATGVVVEAFYPGDPLEVAATCNATATLLEDQLVTPELSRRATQAQHPLWVWTINDPTRISELMASPGVTGVITDRPALGCEIRCAQQRSEQFAVGDV